MMKKHKENLALISWNEIKNEVQLANPKLAGLLDKVNNGRNLSLVLAQYPFGLDILKAGKLFLPDKKGGVTAITDPAIPKSISSTLRYSKIPVGLILDKAIEVYYETDERVISDRVWGRGMLFGLWELYDEPYAVDSAQLSNLSSGARSLFMLPKITDRISHQRLQKTLHTTLAPPASERGHRDLFAELVAKSGESGKWKCQILYLTNDWFKQENNPAFQTLKSHLLQEAWFQSYNCRRQFELHVSWESILKWMSEKNIYLSPRLSNHIKQLYLIAEGIFPGMVFANPKENTIAPIDLIRKIYSDTYQIKNYDPLLMHPSHIQESQPVYYSLRHPSYFETHLPMKSTPRLAEEIRIVANIANMLTKTRYFDIKPNFHFYHSNTSAPPLVYSTDTLVKNNPALARFKAKRKLTDEFPANSAFFHGCVSIELEKKRK